MPTPLRWIARLGPVFAGLLASAAWARVGGGESFSSGSSNSSSDGGGDGDFIVLLLRLVIWLIIEVPVIGIPLALFLVWAAWKYYGQAGDSSTRKAIALRDAELSVKLSATSADKWVEALKTKDPDFELLRFLDRVKGLWAEVQEAAFLRDLGPVRRHLSDGTYQRLLTHNELLRLQGVRDAVASMEVLDLSLVGLEQTPGFDTLQVAIKAQGRDSEVPEGVSDASAREVARSAQLETFIEIWSFVRSTGTKTVSNPAACPNCGALWDGGATNVCGHCTAVVNSGVYDWVLAEITQGMEAHQTAPVPGLDALRATDPAFHVEGLEDRASLCFWKWIHAQVAQDPDALVRLASPALVTALRAELDALEANGQRRGAADCAVGSAVLRTIERDGDVFQASVEIRFSARWGLTAAGSGALPVMPLRWVFVLERKVGATTDSKRGISSSCCPNCGAPMAESTAPACEFCAAPLGTGEKDWVLAAAVPWERWLARNTVKATEERRLKQRPLGTLTADRTERQRLLYAMGQLAAADGAVHSKEKDRLLVCARRWGLPPEDVERALSPASRAAGLTDPLKRGSPEAEAFMYALIDLARLDGKVDHNEKQLLAQVAAHLGLQPKLSQMLKA
jgi:predicted lipid-binding transport protein (Tim44 family)/uncharacterized tellurite resistance protein B-like protein